MYISSYFNIPTNCGSNIRKKLAGPAHKQGTMVDWRGLEKDFRDIPDSFSDMRADWSDQPGLRNHWLIAAGMDGFARGRFMALARQAGRFLLVSSLAIGKCFSDLRAIEDDMARWLTAVREVTGRFEFGPVGPLFDENNTPIGNVYTGTIRRVIEASALLCLQLSTEETTTSSTSYDAVRLRLHPDEIDSFQKIREICPPKVQSLLDKAGRIDLSEDFIQTCLEDILSMPLHKQDWGGEENDLYTANVVYDGKRITAAFALKGRGQKHIILEISDCGKNGDQLVKLFQSPADLFVLQYVGEISENVIKDMEGKTELHRQRKKPGWYCVLNGQDTARLLLAYGKL